MQHAIFTSLTTFTSTECSFTHNLRESWCRMSGHQAGYIKVWYEECHIKKNIRSWIHFRTWTM